jgi:exosortase/archaeosortase family protein
MKRKKETRKKLWTVALFLIAFNVLAIPMYLLLWLNLSFPPLQTLLTEMVYSALKILGYSVELVVSQISLIPLIFVPQYAQKILITWDSTGWKTLYTLAALTIATPSVSMREKLKFLAIGLPFLFVLNFVRILTTITFAISYGFQYFEVVHTLLWREGLILAVVLVWYMWLRVVKFKDKKQSIF